MANTTLKKRVARLELQLEPGEVIPAVFVGCVDARRPGADPADLDHKPSDYSDDGIIGVTFGTSAFSLSPGRVSRMAGESVDALKERAMQLAPGIPVFMFAYGCNRQHFDESAETPVGSTAT